MEALINNLAGTVKYATLGTQRYLVVPTVLAVHGVLNGSGGALYYPEDELSRNVSAWNYKPVTLGHPKSNGTADDPKVVAEQQVGVIMHAKYQTAANGKPGRLVADCYLEPDRLRDLAPKVLEALESDTISEVSTGLYVDQHPDTGIHNGVSYTSVARNYKPDHLAILLDQTGACSVAHGCGLMRNSNPEKKMLELVHDGKGNLTGVKWNGTFNPATDVLFNEESRPIGWKDPNGGYQFTDGTKTQTSDAGNATSKLAKVIDNAFHNETPLPAMPAWDWDGTTRVEPAPTLMANGKRPPNYSGAAGAPPTTWRPMGETPLPATPIMNFDDRRPVANSNACSCKGGAKPRPAVANALAGEETPLPAPCWD